MVFLLPALVRLAGGVLAAPEGVSAASSCFKGGAALCLLSSGPETCLPGAPLGCLLLGWHAGAFCAWSSSSGRGMLVSTSFCTPYQAVVIRTLGHNAASPAWIDGVALE